MISNDGLVYLLFSLACLITGLSKSGLGGTLGFLSTPLLALVMPLQRAVGLMLPVLILADLLTLAAYWRKWDTSRLGVLLPGAFIGVLLATFVLTGLPVLWLRRGLAALVIGFVAYKAFEKRLLARITYQPRPWHGVLAGGASGFISTLANAGGPPMAVYLLLQKLEPAMFVATSSLFFILLNWIKVPFFAAGGMFDWPLQIRLAPAALLVVVGVGLGKQFTGRVNRVLFERVVLALLLVSAVLLIRS